MIDIGIYSLYMLKKYTNSFVISSLSNRANIFKKLKNKRDTHQPQKMAIFEFLHLLNIIDQSNIYIVAMLAYVSAFCFANI